MKSNSRGSARCEGTMFFKDVASGPLAVFVNSLTDATAYKIAIFGLILVVMMKVRPQGILPEQTAARRRPQ